MNMLKATPFESGARARRIDAFPSSVKLVALIFSVGCSFQNFDELTNGAGTAVPSVGGTKASGGTGVSIVGGTNSTAGGETANGQGGSTQGGTQTTSLGGSDTTQGGATQGGSSQTGGSATGGASALPCPLYTGTGGTVVTPPTNAFESNMAGWSTVSERATALALVQGSTDACQGSGYVHCPGSARTANWDGPALNVLPYLTQGHSYTASVAARFDPQNPPPAAAGITFSMALYCTDSAITTQYLWIGPASLTLTNWVRLSGSLVTSLSGCPSLSRLIIYVESDATAAAYSLQIDDFQLFDTTTTATGTGGAPSTSTTSIGGGSSVGGGTSSSIGGASPTGGAPPGGGAPASGGALGTGGADAGVEADGGD